jgi:hypothetical protein
MTKLFALIAHLALVSLLLFSGCVHIHMQCPTDGTQVVGLGGNNFSNFIAGASAAAVGLAPLLATGKPTPKLGAGPVATSGSTFDETTLDLFPETVYCGSRPPPSASSAPVQIQVMPAPAPAPAPAPMPQRFDPGPFPGILPPARVL